MWAVELASGKALEKVNDLEAPLGIRKSHFSMKIRGQHPDPGHRNTSPGSKGSELGPCLLSDQI